MSLEHSINVKRQTMKEIKSKEIDIIGIIKKMLNDWKTLAIFVIAGGAIGVIVALSTPKRYTTTVILAPELASGSSLGSGLSNIASMVGINLGSNGNGVDAIYPQIYPDVLTSSDFILSLFDVNVKEEEDSVSKTYYQYLTEEKSIPFWSYPSIWINKLFSKAGNTKSKTVNKFKLTKKQDAVLNEIRGNIACIIDKNTSVITLSITDADRQISAILADTIQKRLQDYITVYRTKKARMDLAFSEKLYRESKAQYVQAQQKYSAYSDANTDIVLESFKAKREELENEMQLKYNIYTQTVQQLQIAKAKVQENTPAFSVIQSASVPIKASSTPRMYIVLLYLFIAIVLDAIWVTFIKDYLRQKKENN